ncbi:MAG: cytochrome C oxidase subunit IV family protein [Candidatus Rokubacteria bacterium]|nr:cytochrome C oxidase subunit IV family protein [Candidatus Rokubacteria bacterium]
MEATAHKHPNYMAIFWYLAILTVIEIAVIYMPLPKLTIGVLLCGLALGKATLVAMYFMHLRFEARALGLIAMIPLAIATLLVFLLLPDGFAVAHKSQAKKPVVSAPVKH